MNSLVKAVAVAVALAAPIASFAQADTNNQPLTRAQVRAELVQLEKAGYDPTDWYHYPENIQAARAKIAAQNGAGADTSGYGANAAATAESGRSAPLATPVVPVYRGR